MNRRRIGRFPLLLLAVGACVVLIVLSGGGALSSLEGLLAAPLEWVSGLVTRTTQSARSTLGGQRTYEELSSYAGDLETQLARITSEVVALREIGSDYQRLAELANYASQSQNQEFVSADVIARDTVSALRTIAINRGARDGIRVGMPVVAEDGYLIGRISAVSANAAQVILITSELSAVSARLQTTRVEGSVIGLASGTLRLTLLPQGAQVQVGDLVLTSGLGGLLPADLVIGQITSTRQFESDIEQSAELRSFVDFDRLEIVMVITSFEPVDLSVFEPTPNAPEGR
jgi:rod shape-determining protein MreC